MRAKFEHKSLNLGQCKRPALLTCEVKQGALRSRDFRWVQGALALPLAGRTSFDREVKTEKCAEFTPLSKEAVCFRWVQGVFILPLGGRTLFDREVKTGYPTQ